MTSGPVVTGGPSGIEIEIDELVLRGIPPHQAEAVRARLTERLQELAATWASSSSGSGALSADRAESSRRLSTVSAPSTSPGDLGTALAERVWADLAGGGRVEPNTVMPTGAVR